MPSEWLIVHLLIHKTALLPKSFLVLLAIVSNVFSPPIRPRGVLACVSQRSFISHPVICQSPMVESTSSGCDPQSARDPCATHRTGVTGPRIHQPVGLVVGINHGAFGTGVRSPNQSATGLVYSCLNAVFISFIEYT